MMVISAACVQPLALASIHVALAQPSLRVVLRRRRSRRIARSPRRLLRAPRRMPLRPRRRLKARESWRRLLEVMHPPLPSLPRPCPQVQGSWRGSSRGFRTSPRAPSAAASPDIKPSGASPAGGIGVAPVVSGDHLATSGASGSGVAPVVSPTVVSPSPVVTDLSVYDPTICRTPMLTDPPWRGRGQCCRNRGLIQQGFSGG